MKHAAKRRVKPARRATVWVFLLSVLLFALMVVLPQLRVSDESPVPAAGEQGRVRHLLLLIRDGETLVGAVVLRTDTATLRIRVTAYPKQTEVVRSTSVETLAACYAAEGADVAARLAAATGVTYDAVLRLSADAVGELVARAGIGITYSLPQAMGDLPAGEQTLTARQLAEVLCYENWSPPVVGQAQVHAELVAAIIDRCLSPRGDVTALFRSLTAVCDDRLTVAGFTVLRDELETLAAANTAGLCTAEVPSGRIVGVGESRRYVLTE